MSSNEIDECAASIALKILGRKWTLFIVCELLMNHRLYFGQLQVVILGNYGEMISARVLSESLSRLEENGLIQRTEHRDTTPTRVSHSLTKKGEDLIVIFAITKGWGLKWGQLRTKNVALFHAFTTLSPQ